MPSRKSPKFIFISGGVISGLGKGVTASSLGLLFKARGYRVTIVKCDMYLNIDAGTMNPIEHGEVFVTADGVETDQDLGHYERFLGETLSRENYLTAGQIYSEVLRRERALEYGGECVEAYWHIPPEVTRRLKLVARKHRAEIVIVELGGTVGEYQNIMFYEAARRMILKEPENVLFVHVGYLPIPVHLGEMKTKPLQQSIHVLHSLGIHPDFVVCRSEKRLDSRRQEKIALASGLLTDRIIDNPDLPSVYEVPLFLEEQSFPRKALTRLGLPRRRPALGEWRKLVKRIESVSRPVKIGIVAKYIASGKFSLEDSYVCVLEAIKHAAWDLNLKPEVIWFDSEKLESLSQAELAEKLRRVDGIIVPQGWGSRGVEGKIKAITYAREEKMPFLGLCFGMQLAVVEFARKVVGLKGANSTEVNLRTPYPVIHIMSQQEKYLAKHQYGGTIRLGAWPCQIKKGTRLYEAYGKTKISERHRHRYEVNNRYKRSLEAKGMIISGTSPDGKLIEAIELPKDLHSFFVGTQFHPEYQSTPLCPHPLFLAFIKAAKKPSS